MSKRNYGIVLLLLLFGVGIFILFKNLNGGSNFMESNNETSKSTNQSSVSAQTDGIVADIKTSKGTIRVNLFTAETPQTVTNFIKKAQTGYYSNLTFHRVEDWVIQGGDPLGTGTGGGSMKTELTQRLFKEGSVGVARGGDISISNDSQFFICTTDCDWLTGKYTNFGEVTSGMDIARKISVGDTILEISVIE